MSNVGTTANERKQKEGTIDTGCGLLRIKRGLLFFWALWLSIVFTRSVADGLKALKVLPHAWPFSFGNYPLVVKITSPLLPEELA